MSSDQVEMELKLVSETLKTLMNSTTHVNEQIWDVTRYKRSLIDRQQQLREEQYHKDRWNNETTRHASDTDSEMQVGSCKTSSNRLLANIKISFVEIFTATFVEIFVVACQ